MPVVPKGSCPGVKVIYMFSKAKYVDFIEPASSSRPQLSGGTDFFRFSSAASKSVTLQCPAQGFPVPFYR